MQSVSINSVLLNSLGGGANVAGVRAVDPANPLALAQAPAALGQAASVQGPRLGLGGGNAKGQALPAGKGLCQAADASPKPGDFLAAWIQAGQLAQAQTDPTISAAVADLGVQAGQNAPGAMPNSSIRWMPNVPMGQAAQVAQIMNSAVTAQVGDGLNAQLPAAPAIADAATAQITAAAPLPAGVPQIQDSAPEAKPQISAQSAAIANLFQQAQAQVEPNGQAKGLSRVTLGLQRPGGIVSVTVPEVAAGPLQLANGQPIRQTVRSMAKSPMMATAATDAGATISRPSQAVDMQAALASVTKASPAGDGPAGQTNIESNAPAVTIPVGVASAIETSASADAARIAQTGPAEAAGSQSNQGISGQIAQAFASVGSPMGQQLTIRLDPPELGMVRLRLHSQGGVVRGVVEVDNARTLGDIKREAPALVHRLNADGVAIKSMDVVMTPNTSGDPSSQMQFHDRQGAANYWSQQGSWGGDSHTWSHETSSGGEASGAVGAVVAAAPTVVSDQAINIWI